MGVDPSVLGALKSAVESDGGNVALRLHYAGMLLEAGQPADALAQCQTVLASNPDHRDALELAAKAADEAQDPIRAAGYRKLVEALGWSQTANMLRDIEDPDPTSTPSASPGKEPVRITSSGPVDHDEVADDSLEFVESKVTLADVAGLEHVKRRIEMSFLAPLRNPELRAMYKKSLRGGLMLFGPPGCGKTFIARAIAGEMGAAFVSVGLVEILDMYIGESEKNLHAIFEQARRRKPCVLFLDEIDALGRRRSLMREHAGRTVVNQLLQELDGMNTDNENLYVIAATNHPWDVDSALKRPGRFDRTVLVLPPDAPARRKILADNLLGRPYEDVDIDWVAKNTDDYSGADIAHLCDSAAEHAMEDSIKRGANRPITTRDFKDAMKEVKPSTRPWFETARNHALYANEGGVYDELLDFMKSRKLL
ncbi:MAG: AAA family ATPase [Fimbriimonadaceae bacterium]